MDISIEKEELAPFFHKWHVRGFSKEMSFNEFVSPDDGSLYHDHPFSFNSSIISGGYIEEILIPEDDNGDMRAFRIARRPGTTHRVEANTIHRIVELLEKTEEHPEGYCLTLMVPLGEYGQKPGFFRVADEKLYHRFYDSQEWQEYKP